MYISENQLRQEILVEEYLRSIITEKYLTEGIIEYIKTVPKVIGLYKFSKKEVSKRAKTPEQKRKIKKIDSEAKTKIEKIDKLTKSKKATNESKQYIQEGFKEALFELIKGILRGIVGYIMVIGGGLGVVTVGPLIGGAVASIGMLILWINGLYTFIRVVLAAVDKLEDKKLTQAKRKEEKRKVIEEEIKFLEKVKKEEKDPERKRKVQQQIDKAKSNLKELYGT
jgi:hypothetical protein